MIRRFACLTALVLVFSPMLNALTVDELLSQIEYQEGRVKAVKFNYHQETTFLNNGPKAQSEGTALLQKPSMLRLQQNQPEERWTISDGKKTWIYTPEQKQAWLSKKNNLNIMANLNVVPLEKLGETLRKNYSLSIVSESTGAVKEIRVSAKPKDSSHEGQLDFVFSSEDWIPRSTRYRSSTADVLTKIFNVNTQVDLKGNEFQFTPPAGTEVLSF